MTETLRVRSGLLTNREAAALARQLGKAPLDASHYDTVIGATREADHQVVIDSRIGRYGEPPLLVYLRRKVAIFWCGRSSLEALRSAARESTSLGGCRSGTVGLTDCPYCGQGHVSAFTRDDPGGWRRVRRVLESLDFWYREVLPDAYAEQRTYAGIRPGLVIPGTAFSTGTVNDTEAWHMHRHTGNLSLGYSVLAVLRRGDYQGGLLVLPEHRLAVDMGDRDIVMFPAGAWHGNTAFAGAGQFERLSIVGYARKNMLDWGRAAEKFALANERADRLR